MTPQQRYLNDVQTQLIIADQGQERAVQALDRLYHEFEDKPGNAPRKAFWLFDKKITKAKDPVWGVYMWGGVGRGKTYLMDLFVECLPQDCVLRLHFYHFMQQVHQQLTSLQGEKNPLQLIAQNIAKKTRLICFDEFFVSDITDAMLLGTLFEALFKEGVGLVATSNIQPDQLYHNGLQRSRFLPAIALIEKHCEVINVDGDTDYRLRTLIQADCYHWPLDENSKVHLEKAFLELTRDMPVAGQFEIAGRQIDYLGKSDGVLYISFQALCQSARNSQDYIEIASRFHTVILAQLPALDDSLNDATRRFITVVDEFYERHVALLISAECSSDLLYQGKRLAFEFERCQSRMQEMRSEQYLHLPHKV
ncbi:MAG: Cell division protein ZapE [Candidatus Celerinatantimonas neptuna]|nr:MAG: Cell division protein ZapE [Candidatus Celerinatantimonas neptuna]